MSGYNRGGSGGRGRGQNRQDGGRGGDQYRHERGGVSRGRGQYRHEGGEGSRGRGQYRHEGGEGSRGRGQYDQRQPRGGESNRGRPYTDRDRDGDNRRFHRPVEFEQPPTEDQILNRREQFEPIDISTEIKLVEKLSGLKMDHGIKYAPKKPPGKIGDKIFLLTNFFKISLSTNRSMIYYHYDITIERQIESGDVPAPVQLPGPQRRSKKISKEVNRIVVDTFAAKRKINPVYDYGKNMFTYTDLNIDKDGERFEIKISENPEYKNELNFILMIKKVSQINIEPNQLTYHNEVIQLIDILLSYGISRTYIPVGPRLFSKTGDRISLPENKELVYGLYKSTRNTEGGLMVNVNDVAGVFHCGGPIINILCAMLGGNDDKLIREIPQLNMYFRKKLANEIKNLKFEVTHLKTRNKYRIADITKKSANEQYFDFNGTMISVADYFQMNYQQLKYPHLPCIIVNKNRPKYFPFEVCQLIKDQYTTHDLNERVLSKMSEISAAKRPNARFDDILNNIQKLAKENVNYTKSFNVNISLKPVSVNGRVLPRPELEYNNNRYTPEENCQWYMQIPFSKRFYLSNILDYWVVVNFASDKFRDQWQQFYEKFLKQIKNVARELGLQINNPVLCVVENIKKLDNLFQRIQTKSRMDKKRVQLIVCFIPYDDDYYYPIKTYGDRKYGFITQCMCSENYSPNDRNNKLLNKAYLTNILLKINAKIGGINVKITLPQPLENELCMFIGIDVTHPSPGSRIDYSIAAAVGSYDKTYGKYSAVAIAQERTRQEIVDINRLFEYLIETFRAKNTNQLPKRIIVLRDGVSEGQFAQVMTYEVTLLKAVLEEYYSKYRCLSHLTYIVVQKRHQQRFFTQSRSSNIPAGTVVDTHVTHQTINDFYLCSQHGSMGLSRPAHYSVLYDDSSFDSDLIQTIINRLCFNNLRATKAVSIPTPVHYAHLVAYRSRRHIAQMNSRNIETESVASGSSEVKEQKMSFKELDNLISVPNEVKTLPYYG